MDFLSFTYKLGLENLIQDGTNKILAYITNKIVLKIHILLAQAYLMTKQISP